MTGFFVVSALAGGREDVIAGCPAETTRAELGRLYDAEFRPLVGEDRWVYAGGQPVLAERPGESRGLWRIDDLDSVLRAEAGLWGHVAGASVDGTASVSVRRALYYAYDAERIVVLDDTQLRSSPVPEGAEWYLAAVYEGRMFEALCTGEHTALGAMASAGASWVFGSGNLTVEGQTGHVQVSCGQRLLGMRARPGEEGATLAMSGAGDLSPFEADGDGRAILVRYTRIADALRPAPPAAPSAVQLVGSDRIRVVVREVAFPRLKPNGQPWDALGGAPDIVVAAAIRGQLVYRTGVAQDQYGVRLGAIVLDDAAREGTLTISVWDQDLSASDPAGAIELHLDQIEPLSESSTAQVATSHGVRILVEIGPAVGQAP